MPKIREKKENEIESFLNQSCDMFRVYGWLSVSVWMFCFLVYQKETDPSLRVRDSIMNSILYTVQQMSRRERAFSIYEQFKLFDNYAYKMGKQNIIQKTTKTTKCAAHTHTHTHLGTTQGIQIRIISHSSFQFQYIIVLFPVCVSVWCVRLFAWATQFTDDCLKRQFDNKIWVDDGKKFTRFRLFIFWKLELWFLFKWNEIENTKDIPLKGQRRRFKWDDGGEILPRRWPILN